jgi:folate-binding protein YgfZ
MPICVDLSHRSLLRITGADAHSFLQGQITQDVNQLKAGQALLFAHCQPKGRVLFNGYLWHEQGAWWMELPRSRGPFARERLSMYRLRSQVELELCNTVHWGLLFDSPEQCTTAVQIARQQGAHAIGLGANRALLVAEALPAAWGQFAVGDAEQWQRSTLQQGIAEIEEATADAWIPQMLNWDSLGGISFDKGCYTGQEIVARTHFLGKVKRNLIHLQSAQPLQLNQSLWADQGESPLGSVVMVAGTEALAVVQDSAQDASVFHLDSAQGPLVERVLPR